MQETYFPDTALLDKFQGITLSEMDEVKLMNRTDTKFVFSRKLIGELFSVLAPDYRILDVNGHRISRYKSLYFDTNDLKFYKDHHNGRLNRFKVRIRNYVESDLNYLEIKHKYKGRTDKRRIKLKKIEHELSQKSLNFIDEVLGSHMDVKSVMWNNFGRITLVNKYAKERLTMDFGLSFEWNEIIKSYSDVVICELKQEVFDRSSPFYRQMKKSLIRPKGISKYCLGTYSLNKSVKGNRFKSKALLVNKIQNL